MTRTRSVAVAVARDAEAACQRGTPRRATFALRRPAPLRGLTDHSKRISVGELSARHITSVTTTGGYVGCQPASTGPRQSTRRGFRGGGVPPAPTRSGTSDGSVDVASQQGLPAVRSAPSGLEPHERSGPRLQTKAVTITVTITAPSCLITSCRDRLDRESRCRSCHRRHHRHRLRSSAGCCYCCCYCCRRGPVLAKPREQGSDGRDSFRRIPPICHSPDKTIGLCHQDERQSISVDQALALSMTQEVRRVTGNVYFFILALFQPPVRPPTHDNAPDDAATRTKILNVENFN